MLLQQVKNVTGSSDNPAYIWESPYLSMGVVYHFDLLTKRISTLS